MFEFEKSGGMDVKPEEIQELLEFFSKNTYKAKDTHPKVQCIMKKCLGLFELDYNFSVVPNNGGELSTNYPSSLVILESEKEPLTKSVNGHHSPGLNKSVHFMGNELAGIKNGRDLDGKSLKSPSLNLSFNENPNANLNVFRSETEPIARNGNGRGEDKSRTILKEKEDPELNSVFIETSDFHLDDGGGGGGGGGGLKMSPPVNLGDSCITCSTNSTDFSSVLGTENAVEVAKLKDLCSRARFARCRARFPVSVILYNQKHICRSATLSGGPEIYGRSSFDYLFSGGIDWKQYYDDGEDEIIVPETQSDWQLFDRVRSQDIRLLKAFQVQTIVDLMVEKKKVKFGVNVTSSEKVDKENRYADFTIVSLPYPGCEFFKKYRDNGYNGEDLIFEWNQTHVDANIYVPQDPITTRLNTDWTAYRKWDLIALTQNYLKLLLAYLRESENGLLVHCISGWDRTPLFVSLLRLSLWADGVIHKSLCAEQILYLTLAYDWLLFGHNLEDRLSKGEEILFFCFYFLKYIVHCDYNVEGKETEAEIQTESKEVPKPQSQSQQPNVRTRNDSDVQLDGVLLEGGSLASPEGSSWSLSSCSSSSSKSVDNPPVYFSVEPESWDESLGIPSHPLRNDITMLRSKNAQVDLDDETDCLVNKNSSAIMLDSSIQGAFCSSPEVVFDGFNRNSNPSSASSLPRPKSNQSQSSTSSASAGTSGMPHNSANGDLISFTQNGNGNGNQCQGKTSPVAVPRSGRTSHHRHESSSSASIGSWQFITGTGSLREAISSSDPGSSHSHPSRLSLSSAIECIETSESSCTLVEELTPVEFPERHPLSSFDPKYDIPVPINGSENGNGGFENELDDSVVLNDENKKTTCSISENQKIPGSSVQSSSMAASASSTSRTSFMSMRRERLQTVRAHFYSLYSTAIGFQFKNVNDNGGSGGGGLGSLIGNFATKVGIRSAHRHMS